MDKYFHLEPKPLRFAELWKNAQAFTAEQNYPECVNCPNTVLRVLQRVARLAGRHALRPKLGVSCAALDPEGVAPLGSHARWAEGFEGAWRPSEAAGRGQTEQLEQILREGNDCLSWKPHR